MLLYCPKCKTGYAVEPELIPENGKKMRCAKCGEIWFCTRDDLVEPQPEPPVNRPKEQTYQLKRKFRPFRRKAARQSLRTKLPPNRLPKLR